MALGNCPKCGKETSLGGFEIWQIVVSICFFPIGLLALLAGKKPSVCEHCGHTFRA
ncbi:MAG: DUF2367 domain-containing protein [Elusimicrobia bacterium]|nr:DUF2367 domain-containing protein [Elusimicrobiota bacterium]